MHREFKERYAERGRQLSVMGFPVEEMEIDETEVVQPTIVHKEEAPVEEPEAAELADETEDNDESA